MDLGRPCPFSVTPAARLLSRCVSVGTLTQDEVDFASSAMTSASCSHLQKTEEQIRLQKHLDELQLQLELLQVDRQSADVGHSFHLARRFQMLQKFGSHLQELLREKKALRQRLMRPLAHTNLPVLAQLHRFVVDSQRLMLDFIETLGEKLSYAQNRTAAKDQLALLESSLAQILILAAEMETLVNLVLQWKMVNGSSHVTSEPNLHHHHDSSDVTSES
ncbi:HAUS augmin-like complex subunit 2 [Pholidichthys leucotaenia]